MTAAAAPTREIVDLAHGLVAVLELRPPRHRRTEDPPRPRKPLEPNQRPNVPQSGDPAARRRAAAARRSIEHAGGDRYRPDDGHGPVPS